jgi:hypothetical protein
MIPSDKTATNAALATIFSCGEPALTERSAVKAEYQAVDISTAPRRLSDGLSLRLRLLSLRLRVMIDFDWFHRCDPAEAQARLTCIEGSS